MNIWPQVDFDSTLGHCRVFVKYCKHLRVEGVPLPQKKNYVGHVLFAMLTLV